MDTAEGLRRRKQDDKEEKPKEISEDELKARIDEVKETVKEMEKGEEKEPMNLQMMGLLLLRMVLILALFTVMYHWVNKKLLQPFLNPGMRETPKFSADGACPPGMQCEYTWKD